MRTSTSILAALTATVLLAACGTSASGLTGKDWQLTAITEKVPAYQGVVPASEQSRFTITFNDDGTFDATADCNRAAGTYLTTGRGGTDRGGMTIELGPSTLVACPDGSYSDLYLHALGQADSYVVGDDGLTITLKDGGTLTFVEGGGAPAVTPTAEVDRGGHRDADPEADRQADTRRHRPGRRPARPRGRRPLQRPARPPSRRPPRRQRRRPSPRRPRPQPRPRPTPAASSAPRGS